MNSSACVCESGGADTEGAAGRELVMNGEGADESTDSAEPLAAVFATAAPNGGEPFEQGRVDDEAESGDGVAAMG